MAFAQYSGPPASRRQLEELLGLLKEAGHHGFRDARGPMGFNQRQGGGRFTAAEAESFIEALRKASEDGAPPPGDQRSSRTVAIEQALTKMPTEALAEELRRRGWELTAP